MSDGFIKKEKVVPSGLLGQYPSISLKEYKLWHPTCQFDIVTCCGGIF